MSYTPKSCTSGGVIILDRGDYTSCTINLHGATVTSWRVNNKEMIFVARQTHFSEFSHIRGGIQFVFPMLENWKFGPSLGFARQLNWTLQEGPITTADGNVHATILLEDDDYTHAIWNHKFKLYYKIVLQETKIEFFIGVENPCRKYPFEFNIVQHSLMRVPDVTRCEIIGFKNCFYKDNLNKGEMCKDEEDKVNITQRTNRVYLNAPNTVEVTNVVDGGQFKIKKRYTRDINLWNPWVEKIMDLGEDEFMKFIAVEAGMVCRPIYISPVSCWKAYHAFEYIDPKKKQAGQDSVDIFEGYC